MAVLHDHASHRPGGYKLGDAYPDWNAGRTIFADRLVSDAVATPKPGSGERFVHMNRIALVAIEFCENLAFELPR